MFVVADTLQVSCYRGPVHHHSTHSMRLAGAEEVEMTVASSTLRVMKYSVSLLNTPFIILRSRVSPLPFPVNPSFSSSFQHFKLLLSLFIIYSIIYS